MTLEQKTRKIVLKIARPILIFLGHFNIAKVFGAKFSIDAKKLVVGKHVKKGDAILSRTDYNITNFAISGYWKHAGFIDIIDGKAFVIEATNAKGVDDCPLETFLKGKSHMRIRRPLFCNEEMRNLAVQFARHLIGKLYDWAINPNNDDWYCSEVIWKSYDHVMCPSPFEPRETLGELTVTPQDIASANKKWVTIIELSCYA